MAQRVQPTGKQKSMFFIHFIVFAIVNTLIWIMFRNDVANNKTTVMVYPWQAWITAAWALSLIGHWCAVYRSYADKGLTEYERQMKQG